MMLRRTPLALSTFLLLAVGCATAESTSPAPSGGDEGKPGSLVPDGAETEDFDGVEPVDISVPAPDTGEESSSEATLAGTPAAQALVLYVNRAGRTYLGANRDDPAKGTSFIVARYGSDRIDFPAANYSEAEWAEIMGIVRGYFVPYAIDVTDTRPASGVYTEIAVGDTYSSVLGAGLGRNTVGIAPVGPCRPAKNSVGFVFTKLYDGRRGRDLRGVAETIAHEAGHTLSLPYGPCQ